MEYYKALVYPEGRGWTSRGGSPMIDAKFNVFKFVNGDEEQDVEEFNRKVSFCLMDKNIDRNGEEVDERDRVPDDKNPITINAKRLLRLGFNGNLAEPKFSELDKEFTLKTWQDKKTGYDQWDLVDPIDPAKVKAKAEKMSIAQARWDKMFGKSAKSETVPENKPEPATEPITEPKNEFTKEEMIQALSKMDFDKLPIEVRNKIIESRGKAFRYNNDFIWDWETEKIQGVYNGFVKKGWCERATKIISDGKEECDIF